MPRVLVSTAELNAALKRLAVLELDDQEWVDGLELVRTVDALAGLGEMTPRPERPVANVSALPLEFNQPGPRGIAAADPLERERARLAALPPGPCVGCKHVHPHESPCIECDPPGCDDYVDSTDRDPVASLAAQGLLPDPEEVEFDPDCGPAPDGSFDPRRLMSNRFTG